MQNIQTLKAQVEAAQAKKAQLIKERAEIARLEATLKRETDDTYINACVTAQIKADETAKLQNLVDECAGIVASVPVFNTKTRSNRVWAGSHRYGFGTQIDLIYQLATGILYACQEHKPLLLAHTGLNVEMLQELVDAFGTPTYYSRNYNMVIEAKPYNTERVRAYIQLMQGQLDVVVEDNLLTTEQFSLEFGKAEKLANDNFVKAQEAIANSDLDM